jgi:hypothetical protein
MPEAAEKNRGDLRRGRSGLGSKSTRSTLRTHDGGRRRKSVRHENYHRDFDDSLHRVTSVSLEQLPDGMKTLLTLLDRSKGPAMLLDTWLM